MPNKLQNFAKRLLIWFATDGRKGLPWQRNSDPYPIWVSEIMLQQTQVVTVIPYFERFLTQFPSISALAQAPIDDVLHIWTGLGYYARARNLHKAARFIEHEHGGQFPQKVEQAVALPGIGLSTAGAILSFAFGQTHRILDGNVKRVLCRHQAIDGWPGKTKVHKDLWVLAGKLTPNGQVAQYNQAIMDLGATVCRRSKPDCQACPVRDDCIAYAEKTVALYPTPKPKTSKPVQQTYMLISVNKHREVLLERRPPTGIWGGLWCFPETDVVEHLTIAQRLPEFRHTFSHYHLDIAPVIINAANKNTTHERIEEPRQTQWCNPASPPAVGYAAPVKKLLAILTEQTIAMG
ncbi:MAG: A/G-specific adenine glycosylase [Proteobacteria bacterium]|jgi:A/G-specific adenine glycosylase|nr:A/G-specific adenine glycosylase [Pseudomonadota bacterium]